MKILIIRFSSIGDIVMMTPVPRCLSKQTDAEIHFLTKKSFAHLLDQNPYINQLHFLEEEGIVEKLKALQFDYCIDLHNNIRSRKFSWALGVKTHRINKLTWQKLVKIRTKIDVLPKDKHVAHRALDVVKFLNVVDDNQGMDIFFNKKNEIQTPPSYYTLALRTAKVTKNIPIEKIEEVISKVNKPIYLLGGPNDAELGKQLEEKYDNAHNLAGETSLEESIIWLSKSELLISGDTGMLHIACALKIPTVSVWGATIPEFGVYPYYGSKLVPNLISELELSCRPCSKHGTQKCPKKHYNCMNQQNVDGIITFIENNLGTSNYRNE